MEQGRYKAFHGLSCTDQTKTWTARRQLLDSPCSCEVQLFHKGARAAQPADSGLQHLLQSWTHVGQTFQIHAVPQRLIKPATVTSREGYFNAQVRLQ